MSSWVSHLPPDIAYPQVIGLGMNAEELAANPRLTRRLVQNLNANPMLPFANASVDAVLICVSIQYLENPVAVLRECARVLTAGGHIIISFSNRCFPTKAIAIWQSLGDEDHARLVAAYLQHSGFGDVGAHLLVDGSVSDPMIAVTGVAVGG